MKKSIPFIVCLLLSLSSYAQQDEAAYTKVLTERAQKIVNTLEIADKDAFNRVTEIIVHQYKSLGHIHDYLDITVKKVKAEAGDDTMKAEVLVDDLKAEADQNLYRLHFEYLGKLASELTPDQIVKVKDGMTYGVVKVTYDSYCDMIPTLKDEEKRQLMAWLVEAREHAMDAPSSNKKHEWFGKYKGKFNIYLSQRGYDSQKERKAWEERLKAKKDN